MSLKEHLILNGKTGTWLEIANQFNVEGTNKQKSDKVRKLYNSLDKGGIHILLGCVHVPFHNKVLLSKILNLIEDNKSIVKGFHLCGDFLDLKSLSSHDDNVIDKSNWTLGKEYKEGNNVLDQIDAVLPSNIQKTFIRGNHEDRWKRYTSNIKNYKTADSLPSPETALKLRERGYNIFTNWKEDYINIGRYEVFHGQYCNTTPAKAHATKGKKSCVFFHTHRVDQYFEKNIHSVNGGYLGDKSSIGFNYASRYEKELWQNGFVIINEFNNFSQAELIVCHNNSFCFGGKQY